MLIVYVQFTPGGSFIYACSMYEVMVMMVVLVKLIILVMLVMVVMLVLITQQPVSDIAWGCC